MSTRGRRLPPQHGTQSEYVNHGCRCDDCRASNAAWNKEARERRAATVPSRRLRHGVEATYFNYKCRCRRCKAEHTRRESLRRKARADAQEGRPE